MVELLVTTGTVRNAPNYRTNQHPAFWRPVNSIKTL